MKKTKIICTMGPNTDDEEMMRKLVKAGMDVARFNFSHGDHEEQKIRMDLLKKVRKELKLPIAILLDTKGPEIRTGILEGGQKVYLEEGSRFTLTTEQIEGNNTRCSQTYKNLPKDVKVGDTILIDDGLIQLTVENVTDTDVVCRVVNGGELGQKKGINVPNVEVKLPAITEQDKKIAGYAHESGKGVVIVVNKWDIYPDKDDKSTLKFTDDLREEIGFLQYAPVLYASALTGQRVNRVTELVKYVAEQQSMRIKTSVLNELIRDAVSINPPPMHRGRRLKILFMTQADVKPPKFIVFVNDPELMHFSYLRFLENRLREMYGFEGTPIRMIVRARDEEDDR